MDRAWWRRSHDHSREGDVRYRPLFFGFFCERAHKHRHGQSRLPLHRAQRQRGAVMARTHAWSIRHGRWRASSSTATDTTCRTSRRLCAESFNIALSIRDAAYFLLFLQVPCKRYAGDMRVRARNSIHLYVLGVRAFIYLFFFLLLMRTANYCFFCYTF